MFEIGILQIAMCVFGVVVGIVFGALPGMTAPWPSLFSCRLPSRTTWAPPCTCFLGLYVGGITGGLIPAIPDQYPGRRPPSPPASTATPWRKGRGRQGLKDRHRILLYSAAS